MSTRAQMQWVDAKRFFDAIEAAPAKLGAGNREAITAIARMAADAARQAARGDTGGDQVLSRFGRGKHRGTIPVDVKWDVIGRLNPAALVRPAPAAVGPWYLLEYGGRHAYGIMSRGVGRAKGRTKAARRAARQELYETMFGGAHAAGFLGNAAAGFAAAGRVEHPAIAGKHTWSRAAVAAQHAGPEVWAMVMRRTIGGLF